MTKKQFSQIKTKIESEFLKLFVHKAYIHYIENPLFNDGILKPIQTIPLIVRIKSTQEAFVLIKPTYQLFGKPVFKLIRGYPIAIQELYAQTTKELQIPIMENVDKQKLIEYVKEAFKVKEKDGSFSFIDGYKYRNTDTILEIDDLRDKKNEFKIKSNKKQDLDGNEFTDKTIVESITDNPYIYTHILEKRVLEIGMNSFELETWIQTTYNKALLKTKMLDPMLILVIILTNLCTMLGTWLMCQNYFNIK